MTGEINNTYDLLDMAPVGGWNMLILQFTNVRSWENGNNNTDNTIKIVVL